MLKRGKVIPDQVYYAHTQSMHMQIAQHSCVSMLRKVISAASSPVYEALVSIHLSSPHRFLLDAATNR